MVYRRSVRLSVSPQETRKSRTVNLNTCVDENVLEQLYADHAFFDSKEDSTRDNILRYVISSNLSICGTSKMSSRYRLNFTRKEKVVLFEEYNTYSPKWEILGVPNHNGMKESNMYDIVQQSTDTPLGSVRSIDPLRLFITMKRRELIFCEFSHFIDMWGLLDTGETGRVVDFADLKSLDMIVSLQGVDSQVVEEVLKSQMFTNSAARKIFDLVVRRIIDTIYVPAEFAIAA